MEKFTNTEMNILSTAIVALVDSDACSRKKDGRYRIRCTNGKNYKITQEEFFILADKIATHSGHDSVKDDALEVAREAGLRG